MQFLPRGQDPWIAKSRHMLVLYLEFPELFEEILDVVDDELS